MNAVVCSGSQKIYEGLKCILLSEIIETLYVNQHTIHLLRLFVHDSLF